MNAESSSCRVKYLGKKKVHVATFLLFVSGFPHLKGEIKHS